MADARILFELDLQTQGIDQDVETLVDNFQRLSRQIRQIERLGPGLRKSLNNEIAAASGNTRTLDTVVEDLNRNLEQTNVQLKANNAEFDKFAEQARSVNGLKRRIKELKDELKNIDPKNAGVGKLTDELRKLENQLESTQKDLGLVTGGLDDLDKAGKRNSLFNGSLLRTAQGFLTSFALFEVITQTSDALRSVVEVGAEFEAALSSVGAVANATAGELSALEQRARELGETTTFTANQALEAAETLAIAGFTANEIIRVQEGVLRLAEATKVSIEDAADVASIVIRGFGLEVDNINEVNNVLTNTITTANLRLDSFVEAFKLAGPVAKQVGLDLETTAAAIGTLADAGFRGSIGGTALRASLIRLTNPVGEAKRVFEELQIPLDTLANDGDFIGFLEDLIQRGATTEQVFGLFGKQAASIAVLINKLQTDTEGGSNAFRNYALRVGEVGTQVRAALTVLPELTGNVDDLVNTIGRDIAQADGGIGELPIALEDSAAAVAVLNSQFNETEDAVAAFEDLITTLQEAAADESIQLDIELDSQGNIEDVFTALQSGLNEGVFDTAQTQIVEELFSNVSASTVELEEQLIRLQIPFDETATSVDKLQLALNNYTVAADIAAQQQDNLQGDFTRLTSALGETRIALFDSLGPVLRDIVQNFTAFVQEMNESIRSLGSLRLFLVRNERVLRTIASAIAAGASAWLAYRTALVAVNVAQRVFLAAQGAIRAITALTTAVTGLAAGTTSAASAFRVLRVAMASTPIGAILAGVAALTTAIIAFSQETSMANQVLEEFNESSANVGSSIDDGLANINDQITQLGRFNTTFEERRQILNNLQREFGGYLDNIELEALNVADLTALYNQLAEAVTRREIDRVSQEQIAAIRAQIAAFTRVAEVIDEAAAAQDRLNTAEARQSQSRAIVPQFSQQVTEAREELQAQQAQIQRALNIAAQTLADGRSDLSEEFQRLLSTDLRELQQFSAEQLENSIRSLEILQEAQQEQVETRLQAIRERNEETVNEFGDSVINIVNRTIQTITDAQINTEEATVDTIQRFIATLRTDGADAILETLQTITGQTEATLEDFRTALSEPQVERIFIELLNQAEIRQRQLEQLEERNAKAAKARRASARTEADEDQKALEALLAQANKLIDEQDKQSLEGLRRLRQRRVEALLENRAFDQLLEQEPEKAAILLQQIETEIRELQEKLLETQAEAFRQQLEASVRVTGLTSEELTETLKTTLQAQLQEVERFIDEEGLTESEAIQERQRVFQRFREFVQVNEEGELEVRAEANRRIFREEQNHNILLIGLNQEQAQEQQNQLFRLASLTEEELEQEQEALTRLVDLKEEELNVVRSVALTREELETTSNSDLQRRLDERKQQYSEEVISVQKGFQDIIDATEDGTEARDEALSFLNDTLLRKEREYLDEVRALREEEGELNVRRILTVDVNQLDEALAATAELRDQQIEDLDFAAARNEETARNYAANMLAIQKAFQTNLANIRTRLKEDAKEDIKELNNELKAVRLATQQEQNELTQSFVDQESQRSDLSNFFGAVFETTERRRRRFELRQQELAQESAAKQLEIEKQRIERQIKLEEDLITAGKGNADQLLKLRQELADTEGKILDNSKTRLRINAEQIKQEVKALVEAVNAIFDTINSELELRLEVIENRIKRIEEESDKRVEALEREGELREKAIVQVGLEGNARERAIAKSEELTLRSIQRERQARDEQLAKENAEREKIEKTQQRIAAIQQQAAAAEQVANAIALAQEAGILTVKSGQAIANAGATSGNPIAAIAAVIAMVAALASSFLAIRNTIKSLTPEATNPKVPTFSKGGLTPGADARDGGRIGGYRHTHKRTGGTLLKAEKDEFINNRESVSMFYPLLTWMNDQGMRKRKGHKYQTAIPIQFFTDAVTPTVFKIPKAPSLTTGSIAQDGGLVGSSINNPDFSKEQKVQTEVLMDIRDGIEDNRLAIENIKLQISNSELDKLTRESQQQQTRNFT